MSLAPWRSPLSRALHRNRSLAHARYFQLATVRPNGRPANRTVVFRGFADESDRLQMVTDARSQKIQQIEVSAGGEACWYFPKTREQFRLGGALVLINAASTEAAEQQQRSQLWQALSDKARSQFGWPHPGQPLPNHEDFTARSLDPNSPPETFCVLMLEPTWVDHLELQGNPQNRYMYEQQPPDSWSVQAVYP